MQGMLKYFTILFFSLYTNFGVAQEASGVIEYPDALIELKTGASFILHHIVFDDEKVFSNRDTSIVKIGLEEIDQLWVRSTIGRETGTFVGALVGAIIVGFVEHKYRDMQYRWDNNRQYYDGDSSRYEKATLLEMVTYIGGFSIVGRYAGRLLVDHWVLVYETPPSPRINN